MMLGAASLAAVASVASIGTTAKCDDTGDRLPNFGSSSDSIPGSEKIYEPEDVYLTKIPYEHSQNEETTYDFNKGIRALESYVDSVSENRIISTSMIEKSSTEDRQQPSPQQQPIASSSSLKEKIDALPKDTVTTSKMYFHKNQEINAQMGRKFILLAGPSSESLGMDIAHLLGWDLNKMRVGKYADGEVSVEVGDSVRGKHVYLVCTTSSNDHVMELTFMIAAIRRASAKSITAIIPYYGYSRQDQRFGREPLAGSDIALMYEECGVDHVMCLDLHK
jgi:hypothetical protein